MMEQEKNPLRNSIVLNKVFSYCGLEELKRCRLVCHLWKTECGHHIRKRAKTNFNSKNLPRINEFTKLMKNGDCDYLPMSRFDFSGPTLNQIEQFSQDFGPSVNKIGLDYAGLTMGEAGLPSLFTNCDYPEESQTPTYLQFTNMVCANRGFNLDRMGQSSSTSSFTFCGPLFQPQQLRKNIEPIDLFSLLEKFSNLKELELKYLPPTFDTSDSIFSTEAEIPVLQTVKKVSLPHGCSFGITLDLLNMCPNMTTFKFGGFNTARNQIKALKSLDSSRHSKIKNVKMKGIDFDFETALEILSLLTQSKFELEQLTFSSCTVLEDKTNLLGKLLSQLCQQQSTTLQNLVLPASLSLAITFPQMVALQRIAFPVHSVGFSFPSLSVYFPNLRILDLKKFEINNFNLMEEILPIRNNIAGPTNSSFNLHRLLLPTMLKASQHNLIVSIANQFPLVENITVLYQEPEILECIWKFWPNIIGLDIFETARGFLRTVKIGDRDNAAYLGLEVSDCFQLQASQDYRQPDFTIEIIKPSIRDLKELRTLKLSSLDVTDITGYLGISSLQKLMNLELHCPNITQTCLDDLAKRLPSLITWSNENDKKATLYKF